MNFVFHSSTWENFFDTFNREWIPSFIVLRHLKHKINRSSLFKKLAPSMFFFKSRFLTDLTYIFLIFNSLKWLLPIFHILLELSILPKIRLLINFDVVTWNQTTRFFESAVADLNEVDAHRHKWESNDYVDKEHEQILRLSGSDVSQANCAATYSYKFLLLSYAFLS